MALYECVFIARQDISSAQVDALIDTFTNIIQENDGQVAKKESWGLRSLAYRIKKNRKGHYVLLDLDAPSPAVLEMERNMRLNEDVIRYMTVRVDELEEGPSAVMQSRQSRDERPGRPPPRRHGGPNEGGDRPPAPAPIEASVETPVEAKKPDDAVKSSEATESSEEGASA